MRVLILAVPVVLGSCDITPPPLAQRMKDACDARACPADPPDYIDCMPVVAPAWEPICEASCRGFLQQSCKIAFVD